MSNIFHIVLVIFLGEPHCRTQRCWRRRHKRPLRSNHLYVFDLLALNGTDTRPLPYGDRYCQLSELIDPKSPRANSWDPCPTVEEFMEATSRACRGYSKAIISTYNAEEFLADLLFNEFLVEVSQVPGNVIEFPNDQP